MPSSERTVSVCVAGLAAALLVVGFVSGTMLRHVVQISPMVLALILMKWRPSVGAYASVPIFGFWIFIVVLIWLFLSGLSRIATGHYTPIEIVCTIFMAGFSVAGAATAISLGRASRPAVRALTFILFGLLQVAAVWVSFLKPIASR